jgi:hypothetical protein
MLMHEPIGLHFSGHGIKGKAKGNYLLFEKENGESHLVSAQDLKAVVRQTCPRLAFVFVAACHSEIVKDVFLEADSEHVICINQHNRVQEASIFTFTETFYRELFKQEQDRQCRSICDAFHKAKGAVEAEHKGEGSIFQLWLKD